MSLEQPPPFEGGAFYDLPDVTDEEELVRACESLQENGVSVEYGAKLQADTRGNKGGWEVKINPPLPFEERNRIGNVIGLRIVAA